MGIQIQDLDIHVKFQIWTSESDLDVEILDLDILILDLDIQILDLDIQILDLYFQIRDLNVHIQALDDPNLEIQLLGFPMKTGYEMRI